MNPEEAVPIVVVSLDFDKCAATKDYCNHLRDNGLAFDVDKLHSENKDILEDANYLYIGSNRQSAEMDLGQGGSKVFLPAVEKLSQLSNTELNKLLLPDVINNLEEGKSLDYAVSIENEYHYKSADYNYARQSNPNNEEASQYECIGDSSKFLILYSQIHNVAMSNENVKIDFKFYDDDLKILDDLHVFLSNNTHLIPDNVTLYLNHRNTVQTSVEKQYFPALNGTGEINQKYQLAVRGIHEFRVHTMNKMDRSFNSLEKPFCDKITSIIDSCKNENDKNTCVQYEKNCYDDLQNRYGDEVKNLYKSQLKEFKGIVKGFRQTYTNIFTTSVSFFSRRHALIDSLDNLIKNSNKDPSMLCSNLNRIIGSLKEVMSNTNPPESIISMCKKLEDFHMQIQNTKIVINNDGEIAHYNPESKPSINLGM